ncbi:hypothetical protein [Sinorhizobium fredii]|uniref:hypothetical protein n=1 Tax=Rhizobium fredii TaxID=380 RepID=UPI00129585D7|nr:hypothetical protein [Sinorhizobium fredii]MQW99603.1 hypothetical protein [Sinorhizobium fredii]
MLKFLASVLDQMDLALEHIQKGGVHDARFGLMLTDNALELAIHELAKTKHAELETWRYREEKYAYRKELDEAMGRVFEAKLKFAKLESLVTEEQARTITKMHNFRNELYHVGLQYEPILPALSRFYFSVACGILGGYPIRNFFYNFSIQLPERTKKYFTSRGKYSPAEMEDFPRACRLLDAASGHKKSETIRALADHMEEIITESDTCLDILARGVYESQTRDQATIECQTWPLSFSEQGRKFARENGFSGRTMHELLEWLGTHYPLRFKEDPIPSWQKQVTRLRSKGNPHTALENYVAFMNLTAQLREAFYQGAAAAEEAIDRMSDEYRERQRGD